MKYPRSWPALATMIAPAWLLCAPLASAQPDPDSQPPSIGDPDLPAAEGGDLDVFMLKTFTVTGADDVGYVAADALAGGRINTPIRLTPSAMSSLTRAFLDDVGVRDAREALKWTINATPADPTGGKSSPFNDWDYNFRGAGQSLQGGSGPTRNYFTFFQVSDAYNLERMEFDRGPNAILFGVGSVGGVMSSYTKVPRVDDDFLIPKVEFDNRGSQRFTLDANARIGSIGAARLNLLRDRNEGWRAGDENDADAGTLALLFKLDERTTLRGEYEHSEARRRILSNTYAEAVSLWDGETVAESWGSALDTADPQFEPGAPGVRLMDPWGGPNYNLWIAGQPELGMQDWAQGYSSVGTYLPVAPASGFYPAEMQATWQPVPHPDPSRIPVLPASDWTLSAADAAARPEFDVGTVWLERRFTDALEVSVSAYRYEDRNIAENYERASFLGTDLNRQLPDGSPNPNFGKRYGDFFASRQEQRRTVTEGRAQASYRFDSRVGEIPWQQILTLSAGRQKIEWSARQYNAQVVDDNPDNWSDNMVWVRLYEDTPHAAVALPDAIDGRPVAYQPLPFDWFDFDETYDLDNVAFVSQTRLWEDRFNLLLGARHDSYDYERIGANSGDLSGHAADGTSYSAGAVYYFNALGVFANYATNFDPIGPGRAPKLDGSAHEAATGRGLDYGIRFSTPDHNYYATLSRYESESEGRITGAKIGLASIWQKFYEATGQEPVPGNIALSFDDTESLKVDGYEFELVANPLEGLRLQAGFAKPDSRIVGAMPGQRAYFAAHAAEWEAAAQGSDPAAIELRNQLNTAQQLLDQNAGGKTKVGLVDYTANLFGRYTFRDGWLGGFSAGAGVALTGRQYVGDVGGEARYMDERVGTTLLLAYDVEIGGIPSHFAVNVDNVLDDDDYVPTSYDGAWLSGGEPIVNGFYFPAPRAVRFSASFEF